MELLPSVLHVLIFFQYFLLSTSRPPTLPSSGPNPGRSRFVLVHGAGHGAWCWYKIIPILKSHGYNVTAIDLVSSGINLQSPDDLRSISDYIEPLIGLIESLEEGERAILVGHSLGGLAVSKAMEMFPGKVHMAVFATALMPGPNFNFTSLSQGLVRWQAPLLDLRFVFGDGPDKPPTLSIGGPLSIALNFYNFSPKEDIELATLLVRPQRIFSNKDIDENIVLTRKRYGSVNRIFVVSEKDVTFVKEFQLWMMKNNPPNQVEYIKDSDHMIMISKPLDLAHRLLSLAKKFT
ncbi:PREDICTED: methylesterase 3-like isoform X1 [Tarenaya hassleriana]|uniref:methylesterase 3-like isoform X1 n=1 Tax=Tarenaya hassleriana TaxID=28532 RepID=UPI00053C837F|nr:PREDICTED: methylesterase 3-like isoform X1 [Tarenaya hassleriana]